MLMMRVMLSFMVFFQYCRYVNGLRLLVFGIIEAKITFIRSIYLSYVKKFDIILHG
jgi:hypothetical protein